MNATGSRKPWPILGRFFTSPVFPGDEEATRKARVIFSLLINMAVVVALMAVGDILFFTGKLAVAAVIAALIALIVLVRRLTVGHRIRAAGIVWISALWLLFFFIQLFAGSLRTPVLALGLSIVVSAALLLGPAPAGLVSLACLALGLFMALAEVYGLRLPVLFPGPPMGLWSSAFVAFFMALTPLIIAVEGLRKALARAGSSESRFRALFDEAPMMYIVVRPQGDRQLIADCNQSFLETLGRSRDEVIGRPLADFYTPASREALMALFPQTLREPTRTPFERELVTRDGSIVNALVKTTPETDGEGRHTGVLAMFLNNTERKRAEERLAASLAEKEALLKELYHRTKNNMSTINALLALQADFSGDPRLADAMANTQNRIRAMALVHQKLYEARDLSRIDLRDYLRELTELLTAPREVEAVMEDDGRDEAIPVTIDEAIPCGLILNELIDNAVKHAFPGGRRGRVVASLGRTGADELELSVRDDGVGVPPGFDFRRDGRLGMLTVIGIAESQLKGTVEFQTGPGLACTVRFREGRYENRVEAPPPAD